MVPLTEPSDRARRRSDPVQGPPPADLSNFPVADAEVTEAGRPWFREHRDRPADADRGCWFFSSRPDAVAEPGGRFDLVGPDGTCYLGETPGGAARERCGRFLAHHMPIPAGHLAGRVVSTVRLRPRPGRIADATSPDAAPLGVTAELHSGHDYTVTTSWADGLRAHGFDALLYAPRFTPGRERALALFGDKGHQPHRPVEATESLVDVLDRLHYRRERSSIPSIAAAAVDDGAEIEDA